MAAVTLISKLAVEKDWKFLVSNYDVSEGTSIFRYMPLDTNDRGRNWKMATNSKTKKDIAPIIAPGTTLPESEKGTTEWMRGELPKIGKKFSMDDDELMEFQEAINHAANESQAVELIMETMDNFIDKAIKSVQTRLDWMGYQSMSRGIIRLTAENNSGIVADEDVDYQMDQRGRYGTAWTNKADAKPITCDFRKAVREGRTVGRRYRYAWMSANTFALFASTDEVIKLSASFATNFLGAAYTPDINAVNTALRGRADLYGLQINVVDEDIDGKNPFIDGVVLFTETEELGETHWTTPPDMKAESAGVWRTMNSFICLKKWASEDPLVDYTAGVAYAFPAFAASQRAMLLDVLNEQWHEGGDLTEF